MFTFTAAPDGSAKPPFCPQVGKTALVSRFLNNKFDDNYTPTIEDFHRKIYRIRGEAYRLDILDTSGNQPFPAIRRLSLLTGENRALLTGENLSLLTGENLSLLTGENLSLLTDL